MADFKIPELGENITQGDVVGILVKVGDTIASGQAVLELETDKATIEVPSSVAGVVKEIKVKAGDKVKVGAVVLVLDEAAGAAPPQAGGAEAAAAPMPQAEAAAPPSTATPQPSEGAQPQGTKPEPRVVSMPLRSGPEAVPAASKSAEPPKAASTPSPQRSEGVAAPASPSVRRLAREIGIDVNEVQGSGPEGRISQEDVKEHARRILSSVGASRAAGPGAASVPLPDFQKWGEIERKPMSGIRRKTAEHLSHAWNTVAHVTQFDKADITSMEELRTKFRKQVETAGGNLTVTAVLVKVLAAAVKQFPQFNSSLDAETNEIIYKKYINVGVAVDTDRGLLVPVLRNADQKNITQIAVELHQLAGKARDKKLTLEEMSGGGISISNLGGIGGTAFTPIVNWPEVAILGVSRGIFEPVWRPETRRGGPFGPPSNSPEGTFEPRQLLPLSLSYDHRVIDGADAMRFLRWVIEAIEQPFLLALLG